MQGLSKGAWMIPASISGGFMKEWILKNPTYISLTSRGCGALCLRCKNTNQALLRKAASDRGKIISYNPFTHSYMVKFKRMAGIFSVHENWIDDTVAFRNSLLAMKNSLKECQNEV